MSEKGLMLKVIEKMSHNAKESAPSFLNCNTSKLNKFSSVITQRYLHLS